ncbi:DUF1178 family protein [Aliigemmobacter aestuarii]|uniref:DUF1178 family protein n=1 Tax=Aliigemmobacter aestuarii TaxID=1445661 RepID=A0A4S3MPY8_9RHOB|nr:DUF1178 family protein [Gemmobacter aestuarii]THD84580.1 DUF1178 family protein [Gemmobacter aestuarii]
MIRYDLKCDGDHRFDSWFPSGEAFEGLSSRGLVTCPVCGSAKVEKALMAPSVRPGRKAATTPPAEAEATALRQPRNEMEEALATLRRQVEESSEYVGMNFAAEARKIHAGNAPERSIYGEAKPDEARKLIEDGVPVAPLPFMPARKTN